MVNIFYTFYQCDFVSLFIASTERGICRIDFDRGQDEKTFLQTIPVSEARFQKENTAFRALKDKLDRYFSGGKLEDEPVDFVSGTAFQRLVWSCVQDIPYGGTMTYGQLAKRIGSPGSSRAVGAANGANPVPIIVPCHRVIASDGKLGGYAGGLAIKDKLLRLEGAII